MSALIIVILLFVIFCQWQYIADLRWWRKYLTERRNSAEAMNRRLLEKFTGVNLGPDKPDAEVDWSDDALEI